MQVRESEARIAALEARFASLGEQDLFEKEAIQKEITQIIEKENKLKPYSDEKIRKLLEEKDIYISRRTVTKYREECFIYNSRQRKIEKILWEEK